MKIIEVSKRTPQLTDQLVQLWQKSVQATHDFLTNDEILKIKEYVPEAINHVSSLNIAVDDTNKPLGFIGLNGTKIEMLFVDPAYRGSGIGNQLITNAIDQYSADQVTVNEQNTQAVGFYKHLGFTTDHRTKLDEQGGPYPLLFMKLKK